MSLRIKHLNADTSWLLTFSPAAAGENIDASYPGTFTILIDPWLDGPSKIWSSKFSLTHHTIPSCVQSLSQLPEPDVVIISQDKPDHCNEATLRQLSSKTRATIVGPLAATKKIKSWKHFNPDNIVSLKRYEPAKDTVLRIQIPPSSPYGCPGEVTLSLMENKLDVTGLHNAIGITYRAPSSDTSPSNTTFLNLPMTPPTTPPESPPTGPILSDAASASPPRSITPTVSGRAVVPRLNKERAVSVLYSPHGLSYSLIKPYATSHLVAEAALPLTALFHCFDKVTNPWYLGGNVCSGFNNGLEIAQGLFARTMISAHDEEKESAGFSTRSMKIEKHRIDNYTGIERGITPVVSTHNSTKYNCKTEILDIGVGKDYFIAK